MAVYGEPTPSTSTGSFTNPHILPQDEYYSSDDSVKDPHYQPFNEDTLCSSDEVTINVLETMEKSTNEPVKKLRQIKKQKQLKRNLGQTYTTLKGKTIAARKMCDLPPCRMKCSSRLKIEDRQAVFSEYWNLGSYSKRSAYMASLMEIEDKATMRIRTDDPNKQKFRMKTYRYYLMIHGVRQPICRGCLLKVLGETDNFIKTVAIKKRASTAGTGTDDKRGTNFTPKHKVSDEQRQEIKAHILSFPSYESHYTRKETSKRYLPSHLTLRKMYDLYKESREKALSIKIYSQEFHKLNLAFKKPRADTCFTCDKFTMQLKLAQNEQSKADLVAQHDHHKMLADQAYENKRTDTQLSKNDESVQTYTFDLQQCLPTPSLSSSVVFYKRQLWTYNLTVHDNRTGKAVCYLWYETIAARGANQIASCLYKHLRTFLPKNIKHVIFYSDTCAGQNRNSHVSAMFTWALQTLNIQTIDHKFMIPGHSHLEVDTDHGIIEKKKKKTEIQIYHPHDWAQLIKSSSQKFQVVDMKSDDFYDFSALLKGPLVLRYKDVDGEQFKWLEKRWLRYQKEFGIILFKDTLQNDVPFKTLNLKRRSSAVPETVSAISYQPLPISREKKDDLISLLPLIPDIFHSFYINLPTKDNVRNTDPDIQENDEFEN